MERLILLSVASILLFTPVCLARMWFVTPDGTGDAPTIQAAVDSARGGETVLLDNGTFTGTGNRDVYVPKRLNIISISGNPDLCIIDCQGGPDGNNHRAFDVHGDGGVLTLKGLTITNGYRGSGGAIEIWGCHEPRVVEFTNCRFLENYALTGGAVATLNRDFEYYFRNCIFARNSAANYGGAFYSWWGAYGDGNLYMEDCSFIGNWARWGAVGASFDAEYGEGGSVYLLRCTVVDNTGLPDLFCGDYSVVFLMESCIVAYNQGLPREVVPRCTDAYGNSFTSWEEAHAGRNGNFSACPSFCNAFAEPFDLYLCDESPCLPGNHPDSVDCGLIGAWPVGCSCGPSRTEGTTWGAIKAMYR